MKLKHATPTIKLNISTTQNPGARGKRIRTTTLLAWFLWILVLVLATASFALHIQISSLILRRELVEGSEYLQQMLYYVILVSTLAPTYGTVGAFVAPRRPLTAAGWSCLALALFFSLQDSTWQY